MIRKQGLGEDSKTRSPGDGVSSNTEGHSKFGTAQRICKNPARPSIVHLQRENSDSPHQSSVRKPPSQARNIFDTTKGKTDSKTQLGASREVPNWRVREPKTQLGSSPEASKSREKNWQVREQIPCTEEINRSSENAFAFWHGKEQNAPHESFKRPVTNLRPRPKRITRRQQEREQSPSPRPHPADTLTLPSFNPADRPCTYETGDPEDKTSLPRGRSITSKASNPKYANSTIRISPKSSAVGIQGNLTSKILFGIPVATQTRKDSSSKPDTKSPKSPVTSTVYTKMKEKLNLINDFTEKGVVVVKNQKLPKQPDVVRQVSVKNVSDEVPEGFGSLQSSPGAAKNDDSLDNAGSVALAVLMLAHGHLKSPSPTDKQATATAGKRQATPPMKKIPHQIPNIVVYPAIPKEGASNQTSKGQKQSSPSGQSRVQIQLSPSGSSRQMRRARMLLKSPEGLYNMSELRMLLSPSPVELLAQLSPTKRFLEVPGSQMERSFSGASSFSEDTLSSKQYCHRETFLEFPQAQTQPMFSDIPGLQTSLSSPERHTAEVQPSLSEESFEIAELSSQLDSSEESRRTIPELEVLSSSLEERISPIGVLPQMQHSPMERFLHSPDAEMELNMLEKPYSPQNESFESFEIPELEAQSTPSISPILPSHSFKMPEVEEDLRIPEVESNFVKPADVQKLQSPKLMSDSETIADQNQVTIEEFFRALVCILGITGNEVPEYGYFDLHKLYFKMKDELELTSERISRREILKRANQQLMKKNLQTFSSPQELMSALEQNLEDDDEDSKMANTGSKRDKTYRFEILGPDNPDPETGVVLYSVPAEGSDKEPLRVWIRNGKFARKLMKIYGNKNSGIAGGITAPVDASGTSSMQQITNLTAPTCSPVVTTERHFHPYQVADEQPNMAESTSGSRVPWLTPVEPPAPSSGTQAHEVPSTSKGTRSNRLQNLTIDELRAIVCPKPEKNELDTDSD